MTTAVMVLPGARGAAAQEPGARRGTGLTSPEVATDRRVTFRLRAPEAKAVTVSGDFGADVAMRKSDDGVWAAVRRDVSACGTSRRSAGSAS
jgi:1,4-alpha-glucan branching enzyme